MAPVARQTRSAGQQARRSRTLLADERVAVGRALRSESPRSAHATFEPQDAMRDPIGLLESQATSRVPELVPIRYGRMLASPFAFFRGSALLMAADLAMTPVTGLHVQLCGDAHLSNFGLFGSAERRLYFDINDFDETLPGPWEWDVKRLAASLAVAGRENGYSKAQRRAIVLAAVRAYRERMNELARWHELDVWYSRVDVDELVETVRGQVDPTIIKTASRDIAKARTRDSMQAFSKLTRLVDGQRRIVSNPPLVVPIEELLGPAQAAKLEQATSDMIDTYRSSLQDDRRKLIERFEYAHMARKVVGVGSVGTRAWILLLLGRDDGDALFLQMKEAQPSVLERYIGPSEHTNQGARVVSGQRLMQAASDMLLGWLHATGIDGQPRDFYVRQLRDWKGSAVVEAMLPAGMARYGQECGAVLARAHARSGDRVAIAAYLGSSDRFDTAIQRFAEAYADQNRRDHDALVEATRSGRVEATTGL